MSLSTSTTGVQMRRARPRVVTSHLLRGKSIEVAAHAFDRLGNFLRRPLRRALEEHVLQKMKDAVLPPRLVPPAHAEPETDGNALDVRHVCHGELRSVDRVVPG